MRLKIAPGRYVVAVSGGVDSMALLDMLRRQADLDLIVAHFDHGVREDSEEDRKLVEKTAKKHRLQFVYAEGKLGQAVSEAQARTARYGFLDEACHTYAAKGVVLAHHQDDVLETMILNLQRGTGRRGLGSLRSTSTRVRPLLEYTKNELIAYAQAHKLVWREDSTNQDLSYARNAVRRTLLPRFTLEQKQKLLDIHADMQKLNKLIDSEIDYLLIGEGPQSRQQFIDLPHSVAKEVLVASLRQRTIRNVNRFSVERLVVAIKTARPHTIYDVDAGHILDIQRKTYQIRARGSQKTL